MTRLGDFYKFLVAHFRTKVTQFDSDLLGYFERHHIIVKFAVATVCWRILKIGLLFISKSSHTAHHWQILDRTILHFVSSREPGSWSDDLEQWGKISAAIAQWIRLRLPSCQPRFESQARRQSFYQFTFELCHMEKTKTNKKRPWKKSVLWPILRIIQTSHRLLWIYAGAVSCSKKVRKFLIFISDCALQVTADSQLCVNQPLQAL